MRERERERSDREAKRKRWESDAALPSPPSQLSFFLSLCPHALCSEKLLTLTSAIGVEIELWDHDTWSRDEFLGRYDDHMRETQRGRETRLEAETGDRQRGAIRQSDKATSVGNGERKREGMFCSWRVWRYRGGGRRRKRRSTRIRRKMKRRERERETQNEKNRTGARVETEREREREFRERSGREREREREDRS